MKITQLIEKLESEPIYTWFDLGLFIDRFRDQRRVPATCFELGPDAFREHIAGGVAFVTFYYSIDGVTIEITKYIDALRKVLGEVPIHVVAGRIEPEARELFGESCKQCVLEGLDGFDRWPLYSSFFERRLDRGSELYNELIGSFWRDVLAITDKLGRYVEANGIRLLFVVNANSNPGNVALALANVFVSEALGIPVICNNHDFYWEGGANEFQRAARGESPGLRDHFFKNAHLGEFFSVIEVCFPWESRSWISLNINHAQSERLVDTLGHNPANVAEIGTAVDTGRFPRRDPDRRAQALAQIADILGGGKSVETAPVSEVIDSGLLARDRRKPMLLGWQRQAVDFPADNTVLLQPTRIITRKRIERNFELIGKLFGVAEFEDHFRAHEADKLTLLVTGPVADGHDDYLDRLLAGFAELLEGLDESCRHRVHLAVLFSAFDLPGFKERYANPIHVPDLYNLASMVLLQSDTEGRGLPILESAAGGVPILVRRYEPEEVYADVIGEHLPPAERLRVIETCGPPLEDRVVEAVAHRLLSSAAVDEEAAENRKAVHDRFSYEALERTFEALLERLRLQLRSNDEPRTLAAAALEEGARIAAKHPEALAEIMNTQHRQYLPGYGKMAFMIYLKSLIDPSFFRVEEQQIRGLAMEFAHRLVSSRGEGDAGSAESLLLFLNAVDSLFAVRQGDDPIRHDHSLAYRHRNIHHYPYRNLTPQELTGVINLLHQRIISPRPAAAVQAPSRPAAVGDWHARVARLSGGASLAIDDRNRLERKLSDNVPVICFVGTDTLEELDLFAVHPIRARLGLCADDDLTGKLIDNRDDLADICVMARKAPLGVEPTADALETLIDQAGSAALKLLVRRGLCRVVGTEQVSEGIDFRQLGEQALEVVSEARRRGGFIVATCRQAAMTTDIVDLDRFHIGCPTTPLEAQILGIGDGAGYVQWVPAGLRFTLAHPTPLQNGVDLAHVLNGERFRERCSEIGEAEVLRRLKRDAEDRGTPIAAVLEQMGQEGEREQPVSHSLVNGVYDDGLPWAGALASVDTSTRRMQFRIVTSGDRPQTVVELVEEFNADTLHQALIAWNGGYILNAELVGKLGIPESYVGSPLGLIISDGQVVCPPLFNKPALLVHRDGRLEIKRVSCKQGLVLRASGHELALGPDQRNPATPGPKPVFYDLMFPHEQIAGDRRIVCQIVGNRIMAIHRTEAGQPVQVLPVGLALSLPPDGLPEGWDVGTALEIRVRGLPDLAEAIEAGPLLVDGGQVCIDMEVEGWKTSNSIRTQAARLDYTDMRGPKIAFGLDASGGITVLAVNGRIRESVGATHGDMAGILAARGMVTAMGFDPGGSSTLVVGGRPLNVSPYNHRYESNIFALPPEPRAVATAVIGF